MTPYYDDGSCVIYHGDNADILPSLGQFDMVFTSPPYNGGSTPWPHVGHWKQGDSAGNKSKWRRGNDGSTGVAYDDHEDAIPWPLYVEQQHNTLRALWEHLTPAGAIFYNHKPRVVGERLWTPLELNPGLPLRQIVVWARAGGMNFTTTAYVPTHEWIMVLAKDAFRLRTKSASGLGDVWRVAQEPSAHPAPFPVELPAHAIETVGPATVLDPYAGSGSTLRAAKDAGVRCVGIERSERYCEMAALRLCQEVLDLGA